MRSSSVLLIGRNESLLAKLKELALGGGFALTQADRSMHAYALELNPDIVILASNDGSVQETIETVRRIRNLSAGTPIILAPARSSEELAIAALKAGVNDYLKPPALTSELAHSLRRYLPREAGFDHMVGESEGMKEVKQRICAMSGSQSNVLITGETGTGKELIAEMIHATSARSQHPMVCINCAAIPETLFESELFGYEKGAFTGAVRSRYGRLRMAHRGTIFMDEVGDMNSFAQAKILRAIESKQIEPLGGNSSIRLDVRVIAATNQDLEQMMAEGKFRKDLYFRLDVIRIHLPPLRERKEDIPLLIDHYMNKFGSSSSGGISMLNDDALDGLIAYDWPGNVRELKNVLEAVFAGPPASRISFNDLPDRFRKRAQVTYVQPSDDRQRLLSALLATNWNKSKTAERLQWSRMTVYRKMAKYHIVERKVTMV